MFSESTASDAISIWVKILLEFLFIFGSTTLSLAHKMVLHYGKGIRNQRFFIGMSLSSGICFENELFVRIFIKFVDWYLSKQINSLLSNHVSLPDISPTHFSPNGKLSERYFAETQFAAKYFVAQPASRPCATLDHCVAHARAWLVSWPAERRNS